MEFSGGNFPACCNPSAPLSNGYLSIVVKIIMLSSRFSKGTLLVLMWQSFPGTFINSSSVFWSSSSMEDPMDSLSSSSLVSFSEVVGASCASSRSFVVAGRSGSGE